VRELVQAILEHAPGVRVLVTSQAPLKLAGEQRLPLGGLAVPALICTTEQARSAAAVALFVERARQIDRRFRLDDGTVGDVVAICTALDGSALGVQLAAALLGMQPLAEVRRRLVRDSAAAPDLPVETVLHATLAWSHGLLDEAPRRVFRRLAVALGSLPLPLALAVAGDDELDATSVADALADLVDRSLVEVEVEAGGSEAAPRYRLLEAPRTVALEELHAHGEAGNARARLTREVAALARGNAALRMQSLNYSDPSFAASRWPAAADVQAALYWALEHDPPDAAAIALSSQAWLLPAAEKMVCARTLISWAKQPDQSPAAAGDALFGAAILIRLEDHPGQRSEFYVAAAEQYAKAGRTVDRCHALLFAVWDGGHEDAEGVLRQVRALDDPTWPPRMRSLLAIAETRVLERTHDAHAALNAWRKVLELERTGMGGASVTTLFALGTKELEVGLAQDAAKHLCEAAETERRIGHLVSSWSGTLPGLAVARLMLGDLAGAREAAEEAWPHARRLELRWFADHLALLAAREGRPRMAALLLGLADAVYVSFKRERPPCEERHSDEAAGLARSVLGDAAFAALRREGTLAASEERIRQDALARQDVTWA
jgi:predicted ATPase